MNRNFLPDLVDNLYFFKQIKKRFDQNLPARIQNCVNTHKVSVELDNAISVTTNNNV